MVSRRGVKHVNWYRASLLLLTSCQPASGPVPVPPDLALLDPAVATQIQAAGELVRTRPRDAARWGELGMVYEANDLGELALACYGAAARMESSEVRWPYRTAVALSKLGRIAEAARAMEPVAEAEANLATAHWRLGLWQLDLGQIEAAQAAFERATRADPRDASGWIGLARAHLQREQAPLAIGALRRALEIRSSDRYAHLLLGTAYRLAGRNSEARLELALGQGAVPTWPDAWEDEVLRHRSGRSAQLAQAKARLASGNAAQSVPELESLRKASPSDIGVLNNLALAYAGTKRLDEARAVLQEALRIEPDAALTHMNLAVVCSMSGQPAAALDAIERALALDPHSGRAHELKGVLLRSAGKLEAALEAFRGELQVDQRNPLVRAWIGQLLVQLGRHAEAVSVFEEAAQLEPPLADVFVGLALAHMRLGDFARAQTALTRAETLGSADREALRIARDELEQRRAAAQSGAR